MFARAAVPEGKAPVDYGKGRVCERCHCPCSRYQGPVKGSRRWVLLCSRCQKAMGRLGLTVAEFVSPGGRPAPKKRQPAKRLLGLARVVREAGVTRKELAGRLGVSLQGVSNLSRCVEGARPERAGRIARALGVEVSELYRA